MKEHPPELIYEHQTEQVINCRVCNEQIWFFLTGLIKHIPVTLATGKPHWIDCTKPNSFRRKR